ncbi:MAG: homoserine dehydrogenase [Actinobacteria bacterium]|uniref:Homoserine dehydrogenase n=1 Tax=freshwater metagenome TaxID=449393 RepID=A0A6J7D7K9_9ZZZZ|nr:homoserine dehydrogenase [Actinomycetota bacterium]
MSRSLTVALLGGGTVGSQVAHLIAARAADLEQRVGASLVLTAVAVRDPGKVREGIPAELISGDAMAVATSGVDIVVELMGGIEPARSLILAAMASGSSVVTANKALLAAHGSTLHEAAAKHGVDLYFEASVAGAIPLLRPLRESLVGDRVTKVMGIVNGTTNFMLSKMDEEGADYDEVFAEAAELGYLEADPSLDVDGHDAAAKAAILAELAFHTKVTLDDVYCEGISKVTAADIRAAQQMGFVIKLLAVAEIKGDNEGVIVRVHPSMVPRDHPLASVRGAFNAVFIEAESAGQMMFYGRGAGGAPTASAVLGDVVAAGRNRLTGGRGPGQSIYSKLVPLPIGDAMTRYYVNLDVADRPGVLASIAAAFANNGVSIQVVRQDGHGEEAGLLVRTHLARDADLRATVDQLRELENVKRVVGVMRVEGEAGA